MFYKLYLIDLSLSFIDEGKKIFGSPLSNNVLHFGQALPPVILQAMDHLKRTGVY